MHEVPAPLGCLPLFARAGAAVALTAATGAASGVATLEGSTRVFGA